MYKIDIKDDQIAVRTFWSGKRVSREEEMMVFHAMREYEEELKRDGLIILSPGEICGIMNCPCGGKDYDGNRVSVCLGKKSDRKERFICDLNELSKK